MKLQFVVRGDEIGTRLTAIAKNLPSDEPLPEFKTWEKLAGLDPRLKRAAEMFFNLLVTGDNVDTALETLEKMWC